jgi:hemerythrin
MHQCGFATATNGRRALMKRDLWKEEYRLGVDAIDADHIDICAILERFLEAMDDEENPQAVGSIFRELRDKLHEHFGREEAFLLSAGYPAKAAREHIDQHRDVMFTLDHQFSKWEESPRGAGAIGGLSGLCVWVWNELITADMRVKAQLDGEKQCAT